MFSEKAKWIWNSNAEKENAYVDFKAEFSAEANHNYTLCIASAVTFAVKVNGVLIPMTQKSDYEDFPVYTKYDFTEFAKSGNNTVVISVYNQGLNCFIYCDRPGGVIFSVFEDDNEIIYSNKTIPSRVNAQFKSGKVERLTTMIGSSFECDLTKDSGEFSTVNTIEQKKPMNLTQRDTNDLDFDFFKPTLLHSQGVFLDKVSHTDKSTGEIVSRMFLSNLFRDDIMINGPRIKLYDNMLYLDNKDTYYFETNEECDGVYVNFDMQELRIGYPTYEFELDEDADIIVAYSENINDLRPRSYPAKCYSYAHRIRGKKGKNSFIYPFKRTGARYMMIIAYTKKIGISYVGITETSYKPKEDIAYNTKNTLDRDIYNLCKTTLIKCMHQNYEDCPTREQSLYIMDSRIQMLCGYYTFKETDMPRSCIRMMIKRFRKDNYFEGIFPGVDSGTIPSFTLIFTNLIWEYYSFSKDIDTLKIAFECSKKSIENTVKNLDPKNGVLLSVKGKGYFNFTEWQYGNDGVIERPDSTLLTFDMYQIGYNAFFSLALLDYINILELFGNKEEAKKYREFREKFNRNVHKFFYRPEHKAYISEIRPDREYTEYYTELGSALCVCAGITPNDIKAEVLEKLSSGKLIPITLSHYKFKIDALMSMGDKYREQIAEEIRKVFGGMLYQDAKTLWEVGDGCHSFSGSGSMCHGWSAIPAYFYKKYYEN